MKQAARSRPSCLIAALCAVLALASISSMGVVATTAAKKPDSTTKCLKVCTKFYDACKTRNTDGFSECREFNKCSNCANDSKCKYACAICASFWGYYVDNACDLGFISCKSTC